MRGFFIVMLGAFVSVMLTTFENYGRFIIPHASAAECSVYQSHYEKMEDKDGVYFRPLTTHYFQPHGGWTDKLEFLKETGETETVSIEGYSETYEQPVYEIFEFNLSSINAKKKPQTTKNISRCFRSLTPALRSQTFRLKSLLYAKIYLKRVTKLIPPSTKFLQ